MASSRTRTRVAIITNVVASYRLGFYRELCKQPNIEVTVFCQDRLPGFNLSLVHNEIPCKVVELPFVGTERRLAWQRLPVRRLWRDFDVLVFTGNPRVLSTVLWATVLRRAGKRVAIWGQAHTAGARTWTERLRRLWWQRFETILVYTDREATELRETGFTTQRVIALNNGLDQHEIDRSIVHWTADRLVRWRADRGIKDRPVLLSSARLVQKNRFDLMVDALAALRPRYPEILWCVIGDGPASSGLKAQAQARGVSDQIVWIGPLYDEDLLAPWFLSSRALVHPGAIGLTLLHAFGYGLPVITHDDLSNHMPEIAALEPGISGRLFDRGSVSALQESIAWALENPAVVSEMGRAAQQVARHRFNTAIMAVRFIRMLDKADP